MTDIPAAVNSFPVTGLFRALDLTGAAAARHSNSANGLYLRAYRARRRGLDIPGPGRRSHMAQAVAADRRPRVRLLGCHPCTKDLGDGLGWLPAVLLGTITAVGGGARGT